MIQHRKTKAIYAGSFDPTTFGHMWIIRNGASIFNYLVVAVGTNPAKKPLFSEEQRIGMLSELTQSYPNISIVSFPNTLLIKYASDVNATHILRGVRNYSDFEYEYQMRQINGDLNPTIQTVFLMPPRDLAEVSSSLVKSHLSFPGWLDICKRYVPTQVIDRLKK